MPQDGVNGRPQDLPRAERYEHRLRRRLYLQGDALLGVTFELSS
jgi:hypothetical protein